MESKPVIYEVRLVVAPDIAADFDAWLHRHVKDMLALPGFETAQILSPETDAADTVSRIVQYRLRSRRDLDAYFNEHAERMRAEGTSRFGDKFSAGRSILRLNAAAQSEPPAPQQCPNCGGTLVANFCANCGQDNKNYHVSFHRLVLDFLGDSFTFDSRLFRSLGPLLLKPGLLTREYMAGRRARYIPPLRMYLFISIVFFFLATLAITVDQDGFQAAQIFQLPDSEPTATGGGDAVGADAASKPVPGFGERMESQGKKIAANPRAFVQATLSRLPIMMFILLPLYALLLKIMYLGSDRYYMEHLIFAFHTHTFTFILFGIMLAWSTWIAPLLAVELPGLLVAAVVLYLVLYPWFAMRRNYGQARWLTTLKYLLLGSVYFFILAGAIGTVLVATVYWF